MTQEGRALAVTGGAMLVLCYLLDNCDGEIARLKDQCTVFGAFFDTFVDWIVHAAFFAALGVGVAAATENDLWLWLGGIAAAGGAINYLIRLVADWREYHAGGKAQDSGPDSGPDPTRDPTHDSTGRAAAEHPPRPEGWRQRAVFAFRELFRADFCFIVLGLAFFDAVWVLLPAGAVGAQAYWMAQLIKGTRDYHV